MKFQTILVNGSYAPSLLGFRGPLLREMVQAGYTVHASAPGMTSAIRDGLGHMGVAAHEVPLGRTAIEPLADLAYRNALARLMRQIGPDLVLGYTIKPCIWGALAASGQGIASASLVTGLGYAFTEGGGARSRAVRMVARFLWRRATAANGVVIFQNPDDRDDFIADGALSDVSKARLVNGSGVDLAEFSRTPLPDAPRFLMISRLLGNKGVREYASAAAQLIANGCPAEFQLAGYFDEGPDGVGPEEVAAWQRAGVEYLGPLEDVRPALARASVYVLPSYREGTPRSVLEAMAMGRPVITTDAPGCRETVQAGVSGLLVPPRDVASLAGAMAKLAAEAPLRNRMGEAGHQLCRSKYDVRKVNAAMFAHLGLSHDATQAAPAEVAC